VFTRFSRRFMKTVVESGHISIRRLTLPARRDILLVLAHLPSRLYWSADSLNQECTFVARLIRDAERNAGHARTIVVGVSM
jgi:hypothetical protein